MKRTTKIEWTRFTDADWVRFGGEGNERAPRKFADGSSPMIARFEINELVDQGVHFGWRSPTMKCAITLVLDGAAMLTVALEDDECGLEITFAGPDALNAIAKIPHCQSRADIAEMPGADY